MSISALIAAADRCVRCGLCLPHCPTYRLTANEAESPRGRIAIARALAAGGFADPASADIALDHCLGCRRCEAVCPARVEYASILVQTRAEQRRRRGAGWRQRLLEWLCAHPTLFDLAACQPRLSRALLPRRWRALLVTPTTAVAADARNDAAPALFRGCVARAFEAGVEAGLIRLLAATGLTVQVPRKQTCCGALHLHAGNGTASARLRASNRAAFAGRRQVLCTASGCHAVLADALGPETKVRDPLELLAAHAERLRFTTTALHVGLHIPCTQDATVGSTPALRRLLAQVPHLRISELPGLGCCGAAGTHMLGEPDRAAALRRPLLDAARAAGVDVILSANIGCRLHLSVKDGPRVQHPLEFLAQLLP